MEKKRKGTLTEHHGVGTAANAVQLGLSPLDGETLGVWVTWPRPPATKLQQQVNSGDLAPGV